jgi:ankyrin repeat protein
MDTHICYSLETASEKGHQDCIVTLLNHHDRYCTLFNDDYRVTVLHNTLLGDYDDCFMILLDRLGGEDLINKQDDLGRTLLHYASCFQNYNII